MKIIENAKTFVGEHPSVKTGALLVTGVVIGRTIASLLTDTGEIGGVEVDLDELREDTVIEDDVEDVI